MTKEIHDINTRALDFVVELIEYIFEYPDDDYMTMECLCRKLHKYGLVDKKDGYYLAAGDTLYKTEPNSSEKPNNCEDLQDWKDRMWAEAIVTEPTISKMEQVEDEPQIQLTARCLNCNNAKACKEKHWEGCVYEPKDEKTCETCRHWKYIAHEWQCEACKCQGYEPKTEPQTDCAWR